MTEDRLPLAELLQKAGDGDFLCAVAEAVLQILMESDVEGLIGAARHERSADQLNYRNGYRDRTLDTVDRGAIDRHGGLAGAEAAAGFLFPAVPGAAQDERESLGRGDPRLSRAADRRDRRCLDPAGRRSGAGDGAVGDLKIPGLQALQGYR